MKLRWLLFLAATSALLVAAGYARAARRPRYGGTLRVEIGAAVNSLDPMVAPSSPEEAAAREEISALLYARRNAERAFASIAGSGAFQIAEWDPGKHLTLEANPDARGGRPFVDSVDIQMNRAAADRLLDLEVGKADFAEIPAEEVRHASERGVRVYASSPDEFVAVVFVPGRPTAEESRAREALSRSIDRAAIVNFILQKQGEPAGGLLPQWSSGTAFLFPSAVDEVAARNLWQQMGGSAKIALGYDASDSLEQAIAERIEVNVREAGGEVSLVAAKSGAGPEGVDARLVRMRMASPRAPEALARFAAALGPLVGFHLGPLSESATPQQVYDLERTIVSSYRVVPVVWVPRVYALGARVRDWRTPATGEGWPLAEVWLGEVQ